jgi:hypothetical protein
MGTDFTPRGAFALDGSDSRPVSMEFPLVAFRPFDPCDLRSRSFAIISRFPQAKLGDPGHSVPWARRFDGDYNADIACGRLVRISISLDFCRALCALVLVGGLFTGFRISAMHARIDHVLRFAGNVCLHPDKLWCSHIQFFSKLAQTRTARSNPTLSEHLSMGRADVLRLE